ncbi:MAG: O-antigen ligase family protein [Actinobacteria bacterium]|nr:O-antigen ligase family protein [Actinomycetota bacterium]
METLGRRSTIDARELAPAIVSGFTVGALGLAGGGYKAPSWGWATLALVAAVLAVLVALGLPRLGLLELAFLGGLGALCVWTLVSAAWSLDRAQAVLESERLLLYVAGSLALLLAGRRSSLSYLVGGLLTGITVVCATALSIRLFPDSVHSGGVTVSADPEAAFKLAEPLGYSNALGALAAIGIAVAFGLAARAETTAGSALAAASLPILASTLYLTFGRAAWLALGAGLAAALVLDSRRLQLVTTLLALAPAPALAVLLASRSDGLTSTEASLADIQSDGQRFSFAVALLAALATVSALALRYAAGRVRAGPRLTRSYAAALLIVLVAVTAAAIGRAGGPIDLADRAYSAFNAPPAPAQGDVGRRLFSFSGSSRSDYWRVAWHDVEDHPLLGSGAGSYERRWLARRPADLPVRDAHSLYLETLAELGPLGLLLLLGALVAPLGAALAARGHPLVPPALAAYCCYLVHAAVDWDWELPAVTLAGLSAGAALLVAARPTDTTRAPSPRLLASVLGAACVVSVLTALALVGNRALEQSADALDRTDSAEAKRQARRAARWTPWASEPWRLLGEGQLAEGDIEAAGASFRKGLAEDSRSWELWLDLGLASEGPERRRAFDRASALNPREPQIQALRRGAG